MDTSNHGPTGSASGGRHEPGSVSRLIPDLKRRDPAAVTALWERYYAPLVRVAKGRLRPGSCRHTGPEDVALEVLLDFCEQVALPTADSAFPRLTSREHLWKLLVRFTVWAALDHNAKESRRGKTVSGESAVGEFGLDGCTGRDPHPDFALAVTDLFDQLQDESLRRVAVLKMEGHTNAEIARLLGRSVTAVEVKLKLIRAIWQSHITAE